MTNINLEKLLKKIIADNEYENPEQVFEKTNNILSILKKSNRKEDQEQYEKLTSKIISQHNLKPFFDFFFKMKKDERLKTFILMQLQTKGQAVKNLKKHSKLFFKRNRKKGKNNEEKEDKKDDFSVLYGKTENQKIEDFLNYLDLFFNVSQENVVIEDVVVFNHNKPEITLFNQNNPQNVDLNEDQRLTHLFDNMPQAYKNLLSNKESYEINAILNVYIKYHDTEFNHLHMDKAIETINFRKNMGLPLVLEEEKKEEQNINLVLNSSHSK